MGLRLGGLRTRLRPRFPARPPNSVTHYPLSFSWLCGFVARGDFFLELGRASSMFRDPSIHFCRNGGGENSKGVRFFTENAGRKKIRKTSLHRLGKFTPSSFPAASPTEKSCDTRRVENFSADPINSIDGRK